jgi:hypothetical protein
MFSKHRQVPRDGEDRQALPPKVEMERRQIRPLRPEGKEMTAQVAMWCRCQAFPGVKLLLEEDADATAVVMPMDLHRIDTGDTMLALARKDQTANRLEVGGFLTL